MITWHRWLKETNVVVTLGLNDVTTPPDFEKKLKILPTNVVICDPPTLARFVKLESKSMQLIEVDVSAAGSL